MVVVESAPYALTPGAGCLVGAIFGIAVDSAAAGSEVVLAVTGIYTMPKVSALAINVGDALYWDNTNMVVTETASGNAHIGVAVTAAANPSASVNVRLSASF
jgi:predicted RecA/RadA family phage recombinase